MGLGSYPAGAAAAGLDEVLPPSTVSALTGQTAPVYFLQTKSFQQLPDGTFVTADDIDQATQLALGLGLGTIGSAPDVGNSLLQLPRLAPAKRDAAVRDAVKQALGSLISAGLIIVYDVTIQEPIRGSREVFVSYWNTRRQGTNPVTVKSVF